ncbi:MAG: RagB/SusD family nutrient uptake outer membrane protein [Bacteroidales bacterium]|nr:RagB/SusD family nutrient uptake outer membrane protein [Bacteroidales bacterium]
MWVCASTKNLEKDPVVDWTQPAANYVIEPYPDVEGQYPFNNAANALLAVQHETRLEFATQNHRFFDLRRWGIITETLNAYIQHDIGFRTFLQGCLCSRSG